MTTPDRARTNGLKAFETVRKVLVRRGWEPVPTEFEGMLRVDLRSDGLPIAEILADVRIDYERFLYYVVFGEKVPVLQLAQTMEFVTRANYDMVTGNFELDLTRRVVRFKSSIDFTHVPLTTRLVENVILSTKSAVDTYADALVEVIQGKKTARAAIRRAERELVL